MLLSSVILVCHLAFFVRVIGDNNCDSLGILIYEDLGCTPEYGNNGCPKKYTCKGLEQSSSNCYFRGKSYSEQEKIDDGLSSLSCDAGCVCDQGKFTCAILDCPEWLRAPTYPGCFRKYSLDRCCSVGQFCSSVDNIEKCEVEGKNYIEGEKFYPSNTCLKCVCQKGFKGKLEEPFCRRRLCGQQLKRRADSITASCAAFYDKAEILCCPSDWICPTGSEIIQGEAKSDNFCMFGDKAVKVGQFFKKLNFDDNYGRKFGKVKCECVIPPLMKCVNA